MTETGIGDKIELEAYWTWMGEDGIARSKVKPNAVIHLAQAEENSRAVNSLFKGKKFPLLVNITGIQHIDRDARKHFEVNRSTNITAFAVVVESELSRIVANFFFKLNPPKVPAKLFTDEKKALEWLQKHK